VTRIAVLIFLMLTLGGCFEEAGYEDPCNDHTLRDCDDRPVITHGV
jgi:hypothetical protein